MVIILTIYQILLIVLVFGAIMFIHELGHFLFAKKSGIFVREFSLGLGPKIFAFQKGETQYTLRLLPFGAYVRMAGEDPEILELKTGQTVGIKLDSQGKVTDIFLDKEDIDHQKLKLKVDDFDLEHQLFLNGQDEEQNQAHYVVARNAVIHQEKNKTQIAPWDRQFGSKSIRNRFATIFAGPLFNVLLTIILFFMIALLVGVPTGQIAIGEINENSPAEAAGLMAGDVLLAIDGEPIESDAQLVDKIQASPGKAITLLIDRDGEILNLSVVPEDTGQNGKGLIGVHLGSKLKEVSFLEAAQTSVTNTAKMTALIFDGFRMLVTGQLSMNDLAGPVGIMQVTSEYAKQGIVTLTNWAAVLSLYLGIFNLLPIPALDGSRLMFLTIEGLRGKPIDPQKESVVHLIGFAFLMLLMVVVTVNDISRLLH